ncbi:MAG: CCA tRNA nucleotidyltransferase, partial [Actinobacteria bacterium]|nr:CCA tRNA nucleotidyltransferase [Actinomycetota bacterium]
MIPDRFAPVLDELAPVAARFAEAGHQLHLVGGTVRDLLMGRGDPAGDPAHVDFDLSTDARPDDIRAVLAGTADAVWDQGERFGTVGARIAGRQYEITTYRSEAYTDDSRKPHVAFCDDVTVDLSRRDFTVNAMALELTGDTPQLVDPYDGAIDLARGVLRTP